MRRTGRADFARQQEELKTKKKEAEARLAKITTQLPLTENKLKAAKENFDKTSASLKQLRADKDDVNSRATRVQENVNHLRRNQASGSTDMWNRYGQNIGAVWDEIRKASWHGGQPIGPLGMHVKVQKGQEQYIPVVQASMGLLLISWAVRDSKDRATLTKIFTYCQNNRNTSVR
jgi:chromosome segregation ATPase